jgi:autoinducer 2-degrading protein
MSGGFVVVVDLRVDDEHVMGFMPLMMENARRSFADEPGCLRFDVCIDNAAPENLMLFEVYTDAGAFDAHLRSDHFRRFDTETASMIAAKKVRVLALQS